MWPVQVVTDGRGPVVGARVATAGQQVVDELAPQPQL
jgi:hypothetical protein